MPPKRTLKDLPRGICRALLSRRWPTRPVARTELTGWRYRIASGMWACGLSMTPQTADGTGLRMRVRRRQRTSGPAELLGMSVIDAERHTHDVSTLITIGVGWWRGIDPRANTSMTCIVEPQQGHART